MSIWDKIKKDASSVATVAEGAARVVVAAPHVTKGIADTATSEIEVGADTEVGINTEIVDVAEEALL